MLTWSLACATMQAVVNGASGAGNLPARETAMRCRLGRREREKLRLQKLGRAARIARAGDNPGLYMPAWYAFHWVRGKPRLRWEYVGATASRVHNEYRYK